MWSDLWKSMLYGVFHRITAWLSQVLHANILQSTRGHDASNLCNMICLYLSYKWVAAVQAPLAVTVASYDMSQRGLPLSQQNTPITRVQNFWGPHSSSSSRAKDWQSKHHSSCEEKSHRSSKNLQALTAVYQNMAPQGASKASLISITVSSSTVVFASIHNIRLSIVWLRRRKNQYSELTISLPTAKKHQRRQRKLLFMTLWYSTAS